MTVVSDINIILFVLDYRSKTYVFLEESLTHLMETHLKKCPLFPQFS